ncbi:MAG: hypothetical protein O7G84_13695 [Gammaproteobacteria bacterium]|nr:hypothetical protein [Gammaproteobacteria bacterium]
MTLTYLGSTHIKFVGVGPVNVGLFDSTFWLPSGTRRNITITGDTGSATQVDSVRAFFGIRSRDGTPNTGGHVTRSTAFRISGEILFDLADSSGNNITVSLSSVTVHGTTGDDTGTSIRSLNNANGATFMFNCTYLGKVEIGMDGFDMTRVRESTFEGLVTTEKYRLLSDCDFLRGLTIRRTGVPGRNIPDGLKDCGFAGPFTVIDAGTELQLDSTTQDSFIRSLTNPDSTTHAKMVGSTVLATVSEPYAPGTDTLTLDIDSTGNVVTTFQAGDTTAQLVVDRINAAFLAAGAPRPPAPAVVAAEKTLQISGILIGPSGEVDVVSGTGGILAALGLSTGVTAGTGAIKVMRFANATVVLAAGGTPTSGQFLEANATSGGTAGAAGAGKRSPSPIAGNLMKLVWDFASADATTEMAIDVDTVEVDTVLLLSGASGEIALPRQFQIALGQLVAVRYTGTGTAPGAGIVAVLAQ